ncbi:unnamed protein product [Cladocopium goreaui]|uniref:Activating signal cointegrator 1 complex subunit 3 n=1 Tax=Cladocopium goreaui TaxID=2562237 RepID=A0A9P1DT75_9DINO|nr:unnamed protein product [Cladocopium goreaui]
MTSDDSAKGQLGQGAQSSIFRPRLTGMLRARLYSADRVHFDVDSEAIARYQALEKLRGKNGDKKITAKDGFCMQKFVRPDGLAGDKHDARQYFNSFLNQCGKVAGDEVDRQSIAEFVYDTTAGKGMSMNEDEQFEAIKQVILTFTKPNFSRLKSLAQNLYRYDRFPASDDKSTKSTGPKTDMEFEFGSDLDFIYPLEASSSAWRLTPDEPEPITATPEQLFFNRAKALMADTASSSASKNKAPKSAPRKELIWFRDSCEEHLARASGSSGSSASMTVEELMGQLLETLDRGGEDADQNALIDFLGFEAFEFVGQLIDRRKGILEALTPHKLMFPQRGEDWMDLKRQASEIISKQAAPKPQQRGTSFGALDMAHSTEQPEAPTTTCFRGPALTRAAWAVWPSHDWGALGTGLMDGYNHGNDPICLRNFLVRLKVLPLEAAFSSRCRAFIAKLRERGIKVVVWDMDQTMGGGHCGEGILKEQAAEYIAQASPDFVEAVRALYLLDFKLAVATNSDPLEYDLPGQSREP